MHEAQPGPESEQSFPKANLSREALHALNPNQGTEDCAHMGGMQTNVMP